MYNTSSNFCVSSFRNQKFVWFLLVIFFSSFLPSASFAQQPTATIKTMRGDVLVSGKAAAIGAILQTGDTIQVQSGASVELGLSDGSTIELGENTELNLAELIKTTAGARVSRLNLFAGRLRAFLSPGHQQKGSAFTVETPNAQVGAKFSKPDIEISYNPTKLETIGIAHTVELIAKNLLTGEAKIVPVGSSVIIAGTAIKIVTGIITIGSSSGTGTSGTESSGMVSSGMGTGTKIAIGIGAAAALGGGVALAGGSGGGSDDSSSGGGDDDDEGGNGDSGNAMAEDGVYTWRLEERGFTTGCVNLAQGSQGNGPYRAGSTPLQVEKSEETLTGSGNCSDGNPINLEGTVSGTNVQFRRYGPGCTPGYTIDWNYSGSIQGNKISGTFSGGPDSIENNGSECSTSGTFTVTIEK